MCKEVQYVLFEGYHLIKRENYVIRNDLHYNIEEEWTNVINLYYVYFNNDRFKIF